MSFIVLFALTGYFMNEFVFDSAYFNINNTNKVISQKTNFLGKTIINKKLRYNHPNELGIKRISINNAMNFYLILHLENEEKEHQTIKNLVRKHTKE